ncbi:MAG: hypothetical protein HYV95_03690 [Opitutae bacterium]|nr:hypothetical protein [Opitutae bacterium]
MLPDEHTLFASLPGEHVTEATRLGLKLSSTVDGQAWSRLVVQLAKIAGSVTRRSDTLTAWLGDVLVYGEEKKYRGQITEYARAAGLHPTTLRNAKLVCARIPVSCRRDALSWAHHCEIGKAFRDAPEIANWLDLSAKENLSRTELRQRIREQQRRPEYSSARGNPLETDSFGMLRDLRALDRQISNRRSTWVTWSPSACRLALTEMRELVTFLQTIQAKAVASQSNENSSG